MTASGRNSNMVQPQSASAISMEVYSSHQVYATGHMHAEEKLFRCYIVNQLAAISKHGLP